MGQTFKAECGDCHHPFAGHCGGGFFFHLLRCDTCGEDKGLSFDEIGEPHLRYLKGLPGPYCGASEEHDRDVREHYAGEPISEEEYHRQVEAIAGHATAAVASDSTRRCAAQIAARRMSTRDTP